MADGTFATVVNCMDGRTQLPAIDWMKREYGVDFVDQITEPGADGIMSSGDEAGIASIKKRVLISVEKHGSKVVAIVGHHDCAGNPVSKSEHERHVDDAVSLVKSWNLPVQVIGLWIGESWQAERIL